MKACIIVTKHVILHMLRFVMHLFFVFPMKRNRIMFICYSGKQYSGSPKAIYNYLSFHFSYLIEPIWAFEKKNGVMEHSCDSKKVKYLSLAFYYYFYTSKMVITNDSLFPYLEKRHGQVYIQTWHGGGAYKKVGTSTKTLYSQRTLANLIRYMNLFDCFLSSCEKADQYVFREGFKYAGEILKTGLPRNDLLLSGSESSSTIRNQLGIPETSILVLYVPTFRSDNKSINLPFNIEDILQSISVRFGHPCSFVVRSHHRISDFVYSSQSQQIIDGNKINDVQELLLQTDLMITDYSSIFWDFALMKRPCFIYADDLNIYSDERDFYVGPHNWPFSISRNSNDLVSNILNFNQIEYEDNLKKHYRYMGSYERGNATKGVIDYIFSKLYEI